MIVSTVARQIRTRSSFRYGAHMYHARLLAGAEHGLGVYMRPRGLYNYAPSTSPRNICAMLAGTAVSKLVPNKPLPQVLTDEGSWKDQKRARKMGQYLKGDFYQSEVFESLAPLIYRDGATFGFGATKEVILGDVSRTERILPWEVLIDEWDARNGRPRNYYHVYTQDLDEAIDEFEQRLRDSGEEDDEEIERKLMMLADHATSAPSPDWDWQGDCDTTVDRVRLVEAWHLCSNRIAHAQPKVPEHECDGVHVVTVLDAREALLCEEFDWDRSPIAFFHYEKPFCGPFGMGVVEKAEGWQYSSNEQFERVDTAHQMLGGGIILNATDSQIQNQDFDNGVIPIITHAPGREPQFVTPAPIHPSIYQRERDMVLDALNEFGFSQQSATSTKQPGIESGIALQEVSDIEDRRHSGLLSNQEEWALNVAKIKILAATEIAKKSGEKKVQVPMNDGLLELKWSDVTLTNFQVRVYPTSTLPQSKAARLEFCNMLFENGLIDGQTFLTLYGGPDVGAEISLETADRMNIDEKLECVLWADDDAALEKARRKCIPSAYQDFVWFQKRAQQKLNWAEIRGADEEVLDVLRDVIAQCETLKAGPEEAPPDVGMMGEPLGEAGPPVPGMPGAAPPPGMPMPGPPGAPMPGGPPMGGPPMGPEMMGGMGV